MVTQTTAAPRSIRRRIFGESGADTILPYVLLAPTVLLVLAVLVYPLIEGARTSTGFYRFGRRLRDGLDVPEVDAHVVTASATAVAPSGVARSAVTFAMSTSDGGAAPTRYITRTPFSRAMIASADRPASGARR